MEPLPRGANFVRSKMLWEIGLHIAGNPATPYGGNRDMQITVGSGGADHFTPWLRLTTGSAIIAEEVCAGGVEMAFVNPSALLTQAYRGVGVFSKPLPVRVVASYPSWDRALFMVHGRAGIRSIGDIKDKKYPLKVSVREDPTHSTLALIAQTFALHGFSLKDFQGWGGKLVVCGSPMDQKRRMEPLRAGELDAVFDEGIKTWLPVALEAGMMPIELSDAEFAALAKLGWRKVPLPASRWPRLGRDYNVIDFGGWPIYTRANLPDQMAYDVCGAIAARADEMPWEEGAYHGIAQLGQDTEETPLDVPLHPGAERWYREHAAAKR
ncbi:MAG TPA: TAXI family TRAP transporter solute-binding subunit [Stellaceae bacterium]|nr:TAXI family TRAP transporter solute-binding subunit [Stellaceae bacterium]